MNEMVWGCFYSMVPGIYITLVKLHICFGNFTTVGKKWNACFIDIHTYLVVTIIINLVSHMIYVLCVNFIDKWPNLQFKVDSERFFEKLFVAILFTLSFCEKSVERKSPKKYFSYFVLMSGLGLNDADCFLEVIQNIYKCTLSPGFKIVYKTY